MPALLGTLSVLYAFRLAGNRLAAVDTAAVTVLAVPGLACLRLEGIEAYRYREDRRDGR